MNRLKQDESWMRMAARLAVRGLGRTSPNPCVGAVIVKGSSLVGRGFHRKAGADHAEVMALKQAGSRSRGATLYVSLEPCAHYGRTPPCVDAIIRSGIRRVVVGEVDPNPITRKRGIRTLKRSGIRVDQMMAMKDIEVLNRPFRKWVRRRLPYVSIKIAQSLDGKIATRTGDSKWITSEDSRRFVQDLRKKVDAIVVGVRTVLKDNPRLDVRKKTNRFPLKVVLDTRLRISPRARLFSTPGRVILVTTRRSLVSKRKTLSRLAEVMVMPEKGGRVNLLVLMRQLARRGVTHLLVEGGGELISSFIEERLADEAYFFMAPKIIGGRMSPTSVMGRGVLKVKHACGLKNVMMLRRGQDYLLHGFF